MVEVATNYLDSGAVAFDVHVDVAIEVSDIQQTFKKVCGDFALVLQLRCVRAHFLPPFLR